MEAFLRKTIGNVLGDHQLEIALLFDFLRVVAHHPSRQKLLDQFMEKWESCLNKNLARMHLVRYAGTWLPTVATSLEIRKQISWEEFAHVNDVRVSESNIDSQSSLNYQPLNFKDLLRLTLWKELYNSFGANIVEYIFDKCVLVYEADEDLYVVIANPRGILYPKFRNYGGIAYNGKNGHVDAANTEHSNKNQFKLLDPFYETEPREEFIKDQKNKKHSKATTVFPEKVNTDERKRKTLDSATEKLDFEPPTKKQKTVLNQGTVIPRWIKPKPNDLEKVINHRNALAKSSSATKPCTVPNAPLLNYIAVYKDADFQHPNKKIVLKQMKTFSPPSPTLPQEWPGLRLSDDLFVQGNPTVICNVYKISESLAKKLNIRLKPKSRCRKNRKGNVSIFEEGPNFLGDEVKSSIQPFFTSVKLPIAPCLYNASSWAKWPSARHCSAIAVEYAKQGDKLRAVRALAETILDKPSCSERARQHLWECMTKSWTSAEDDSIQLNGAIWNILEAHVKFNDLHKLMKNCLQHWRLKFKKKREKIEMKTKSCNNLNEENVKKPVQPQVIDIAESTPTTKPSEPSIIEVTPEYAVQVTQPNRQVSNNANQNQAIRSRPNSGMVGNVQVNPGVVDGEVRKTKTSCHKFPRGKSNVHNMLNRTCSGNSIKLAPFSSLKHPVQYNCIMQTLKQVFHIMKLELLLGSKRNIRGFFKFVRKAVILGGTKSCLSLGEAMALIKPEETPFAQVCGGDEVANETFVAKLIIWLFNEYILKLLKMSFYITECGFTRLQLQFYLREAWISASHKMKTQMIKTKSLTEITSQSSKINSTLRFVPKMNHKLRSLVLRKKSAWSLSEDDMKTFKLFLHYIDAKINKSRMYIPMTVMYVWRRFCIKWKSMGAPNLYYLRMDVRDAYPSVSIPKLRDILLEVMRVQENNFVQKKFVIFKENGRIQKRASMFNEACPFNWHSGIHIRKCVVMDLDMDKNISVLKIVEDIINLIATAKVVKVGRKKYEFNYGLPQGWSVSPILCSIYYGHIDSSLYIPHVESKEGNLFVRVVDDYLFISPYPDDVAALMELIKTGCEKHQIKVNQDKTDTNVFVKSNQISPGSRCETVTFCGWNFCLTCGHVSRDYCKYQGQDYCSTIAFHIPDNISSPEEFIRLRGTIIMPTRLTPILLDSNINCHLRVLVTVFEAAILLGYRFYALCRVVYPSLNALKEKNRASSLLYSIRLCCSRLARYVQRHTTTDSSLVAQGLSFTCKDHCCGTNLMHPSNDMQTTLLLASSNSDRVTDPEFLRECLSFNSLLYVSLIGFRLKLLRHSEVFRSHIIPEINSILSSLRNKLGVEHCNRICKIVGTKIPDYIDQIRL